jgi:diadenosine tetraphosphate (Ap4A) HIT family hydrolase
VSCPLCERLTRLNELPGDELVGQFAHSVALLGPWQYYTGYCVLVAKEHAAELHHLSDDARRGLFEELCRLSRAIEKAFALRKLNCESLGNQVPHVHWHILPRYEADPDYLKPAWVALDRGESDLAERLRLLGDGNRAEVAERIRRALAETP